ncbi:MAG: hypothetical protein M3355_01745 [Actinomycetota bacterium]|nr:hypothetical protein [Actinomycetota bacterium]
MPGKADFNAEEWSQILAGPPAAGLRVAMAERGGALRESLAIGRAYAEARQEHGESELLDSIVAEQPVVNPAEFKGEADVPQALMQKLTGGVEVLEEKAADDDVNAYKQFIVDMAQRVASAKKEGGVLGIGGKEISDNEQVALEEIASTLGVRPSA